MGNEPGIYCKTVTPGGLADKVGRDCALLEGRGWTCHKVCYSMKGRFLTLLTIKFLFLITFRLIDNIVIVFYIL